VLVYFNDEFEGGETRFTELDRTVVPSPGLVAVFQHKVRHEGCEVRYGKKRAMRTEVMFETADDIVMPRFEGAGELMFELDRHACWRAALRSHVPCGHGCGDPAPTLLGDLAGPAS
jgi:hypothetical protein